jgi:hypothetical protein
MHKTSEPCFITTILVPTVLRFCLKVRVPHKVGVHGTLVLRAQITMVTNRPACQMGVRTLIQIALVLELLHLAQEHILVVEIGLFIN